MTIAAPAEVEPSEQPAPAQTQEGTPPPRATGVKLRNFTLPPLIGVALLALANPNWLVTPGGFLDPWVYVNYFRYLPGTDQWDGYYKVSRVSWTALGYAATTLFGLDAAQFVLALGSIVVLVVVMAVLLRPLATEAIAFAVTLVALYPLFHGSGGWLYQNTLSGPLHVTATLLGLRLALSPEWPRRAHWRSVCWAAFGFLVVMLAITNTMQVLAVGPVILLIVAAAVHRRTSWRRAARPAALVILGGVSAFLLCAVTSAAAGGRFLFYLPLYHTFTNFASSGDDQAWWQPLSSGWWRDAAYLVLPIGAAIIGLVQGTRWARARRRGEAWTATPAIHLGMALVALNLVVLAGWIVLYALKYHLLNWGYHSYPIALTAALSLAGSVHLGIVKRGFDTAQGATALERWFPWVAAAVPTFLLLIPVAYVSVSFSSIDDGLRGGLLGGLAILGGVALAFLFVRSRRAFAVLLLVALGLLIATGSYERYSLTSDCDAERLSNSAIVDIVESFAPGETPVYLYAKPGESASLARGCTVRLDFTAASIDEITPFRSYSKSDQPDAVKAFRAGAAREILFLRNPTSGRRWEAAAVNALTDGQPDRVVQRSVTSVGSPGGKIELVSLVIA